MHLIKNIKNKILNRTKVVFSEYHFDLFDDAIDVPAIHISCRMSYDVYEMDEKLQGNLRKAPKLTYKATHPGNYKQDLSVASAIFDETTTDAIKSFYKNK